MLAQLPDQELLTRVLGREVPGLPALGDVLQMTEADLLGAGLAPDDVARVHVVAEIARRHQPSVCADQRVLDPCRAIHLLDTLRRSQTPRLSMLLLDAMLRLVGRYDRATDAQGCVAVADALLQVARDQGAAAVVVACNQPDCPVVAPMVGDLDLAHELQTAGARTGIEVLDHLIVGPRNWASLRRLGLLA